MSDARDPNLSPELLFDRNPNPMWTFDARTLRFLSVNEAAIAHYGYSRDEFLAMTILDIRPVEGVPQLRNWLADAPGARDFPTLTRHRRKDGTVIDVEIYATPSPTEAWLICAIDVTARKRTEEALRDARARMAQLLTATSAVTWSIGNGGRGPATFVGENVRTLLGFEREEFMRGSDFWWSLLHPDDAERVHAEVGAFLATGGPDRFALEYRVRHQRGDYRWIRDEVVAQRDAQGAIVEIIGCWIDIHARREMEEALRRSEESFRTLTEHLPIGVLVHREGRILYANRATAALLDYPAPSALLGRSLFELAAPAVHETIRRRVEAFRTATPSYQPPESGEMLRRDGTRIEVEAEAIRIDFDGAPAMLLLLRNLTERHEMVARLAVADRMRSVGMLAAGVAHEINNPLTYVLANLDLLAMQLSQFARGVGSASRAELESLVNDAREGATRVRDVVRDLRALSRADDEPSGSADLRQVLESCFKLADSEIRYRARLVTDLEATPPARGSASRLAQVFLNLLINAAHAIPVGHADDHRIIVRLHAAPPDKVVVEVSDTGAGIAPSVLGRIFEPFFTTKPAGEGTGLGLAICHGIVKSIGGDIDVESEPGRGTTFRVTLPTTTAAPAPAPPRPRPASPARRGRILVIDDEHAIGNSIRMLLEDKHDVVVLTRACDALARITDGERYDAILCDLMMPEMSGIALHAAIAEVAPEQLAHMVFVTGGAFTREAQEFVARCEHPPIQKPFDVDDLTALVDRLVHGTSS